MNALTGGQLANQSCNGIGNALGPLPASHSDNMLFTEESRGNNAGYVDHSNDPILDIWPFIAEGEEGTAQLTLDEQCQDGSQADPFPMLLYRVLQESQQKGTEHIVSWNEHGRSFQISDRKAFEADVMPRYFTSRKFASFVRQVTYYKFQRMSRPRSAKAVFYHEYFLRGRPDLIHRINRQSPPTPRSSRSGAPAPSPPPAFNETQLPQLERYPPCWELNSEQIANLCRDPTCNPDRVFLVNSCSASLMGQPDLNQRGNYVVHNPPSQEWARQLARAQPYSAAQRQPSADEQLSGNFRS